MQSLSLPGSVSRDDVALLRVTSACAARLASRARAARMMRATIDSAIVLLWFSQCSSAGRTIESTIAVTSGLFRRSFVCPWNCGSLRKMLSTPMHALADVLGRERHALRRQVVRVDEVADRLADARAQAVLVRAARAGRNAVDVAAEVLVGRFRPLQDEVELEPGLVVLARERERRVVHRLRFALAEDLLQVVADAFVVLEDLAARLGRPRAASFSKMTFSPCGGSSRPRAARG